MDIGYTLVTTRRGNQPTKAGVTKVFVERIRPYTIEMPRGTMCPTCRELLLPKQNYEKILNQTQDFLRDDSIAGDVVTLIEAIESEHMAIIFEMPLD